MPMRPNTNVQRELDRLKEEYELGLSDGYDANPNQPPEWFFTKTLSALTARERGFFVGRELRLEGMEAA